MKARIPGRGKKVSTADRELIRTLIRNVSHQTLIEDFDFGPKGRHGREGRLQRFYDGVNKRLNKYDTLYSNSRDEINAIRERCISKKIDYGIRRGSGGKVELANEHDIIMCIALLVLREDFRFGKRRLQRFFDGVERRIRYYNDIFEGHPLDVLQVSSNRLYEYGVKFTQKAVDPQNQK